MLDRSLLDPWSVDIGGDMALPLIGFGTYDIAVEATYDAVRVALDAGYRHIDTAYGYANEAEIGRALADSRIPRDEVFLTTKVPSRRIGHEDETVANSLRGLRTDHVDLWLIHDPPAGDASIRLWQRFIDLRERGLARTIGVSNYTTEQLDALVAATGVTPAVNQIRWTPALHDPARASQLARRGVQLEGFSAIRRTNLADPVLTKIAADHGVTAAQVVLRWHLEHRYVTLPRSTNPDHIRENLDLWGFGLTSGEVAAIDALSTIVTADRPAGPGAARPLLWAPAERFADTASAER